MPSIKDFQTRYPNATLVDQVTGETIISPKKDCTPCTVESGLKMVEPGVAVVDGVFVAMIPAILRSEANESQWHRKMLRKLSSKKAVRDTLGPHLAILLPYAEAYHAGKGLRAKFTKLGGRKLDVMANLGNSMKAIEDAVAWAMLVDDGDSRWHATPHYEPGELVGVRVEISIFAD